MLFRKKMIILNLFKPLIQHKADKSIKINYWAILSSLMIKNSKINIKKIL